MRTTVNIDDALLREAKSLALKSGRPLGEVVDDALRVLFAKGAAAREQSADFRLPTCDLGGLQPGVDLEDKEAMAELLGDNEGW